MTEKTSLPENENIQNSDAQAQGNSKVSSTDKIETTASDTAAMNNEKNKASVKKNKKDKQNQKTEINSASASTNNNEMTTKNKSKTPVSKLSIIAILLTLGLGAGIYFHGHKQASAQRETILSLQNEITSLRENLSQEIRQEFINTGKEQNLQLNQLQQSVDEELMRQKQSQQQFITQVNDAIKVNEYGLQHLHEQLSALSSADNTNWLISQANYLVNLAGRKIWNDQDFVTARLLLKSADSSLAETNDPSLLPARQAITNDIAALALISHVDFDGMTIKLMTLANQVSELPLIDNYQSIDIALTGHDDSFAEEPLIEDSSEIATTPSEGVKSTLARWSDNLVQNGHAFLQNFISIEKYDEFTDCMSKAGQNNSAINQCQVYRAVITPEQSLYLRENIRLQLFIAAQSVSRHQDDIYQQALRDVSTWIYAYFNTTAPLTQAFLDEITLLQEQTISQRHVPEKLESAAILERLMQMRVRSLLTAN